MYLTALFTQKQKIRWLFTRPFRSCMTFFLLCNTKKNILKVFFVHTMNDGSSVILNFIDLTVELYKQKQLTDDIISFFF